MDVRIGIQSVKSRVWMILKGSALGRPFRGPAQLKLGHFEQNRLEISETENCEY